MKQVLAIDNSESSKLILNWSHSNLFQISKKQTYHIILIYHNIASEARSFLERYVRSLKYGDMFCALYVNE